jgi:uncharacterized membrane protein YhaH (DUF805 family)
MATSRTEARTIAPARDPGDARRWRLGVALVVVLLTQVLLGVANELWTALPGEGDPFTGAVPQWLLSAHVLVGTVAVVLATVLAVSARRARDAAWSVPAGVGLATRVGAWLSGHVFLVTRGADGLSMSMAALAMTAVAAYVVGLVRASVPSAIARPGSDDVDVSRRAAS